MCGLVGAWSFNSADGIDAALLERMRDVISHRGPDGAGIWMSADGRLGLAHRRLAVIDLSPQAAQPMASTDGDVIVVYNGEIYNHAEVRAELDATSKRPWRTDHSDTEVLIRAYQEWGQDCLHRFRGIFAFALWDARRRVLWLVRDRFGVKPIYYAMRAGRVTFASEIKALLADPGLPRAVDETALYHYLSFLCVPAPATLFAGIRKVPAGCCIEIDASGELRERRWYDPWEHVRPLAGISDGEAAERVLRALRESVALRAVSDVPVGVFLSGGVDSSTNLALFKAAQRHDIDSFTVGYGGGYASCTDELAEAREIAAAIGSRHHERIIKQSDLLDVVDHLVELQDEPIADPVCLPVLQVATLARAAGMTVAHAGEGSDELFCGYPYWRHFLNLERLGRLPVPGIVQRAGLAFMRMAGKGRGFNWEFLRRITSGQPVFWSGAESFTDADKDGLLGEGIRRRLHGLTSWEAIRPTRERFLARAWEPSAFNWMTTADLNLRLPELLLMRLDKMCMGVGLECREPFLDHKLVELVLSIPTAQKLRGGGGKPLLKQAIRGIIPAAVIRRKKVGFGAPVQEWFHEQLGQRARMEIEDFCKRSGLISARSAARVLERNNGLQSWTLFNLALWHKRYIA